MNDEFQSVAGCFYRDTLHVKQLFAFSCGENFSAPEKASKHHLKIASLHVKVFLATG